MLVKNTDYTVTIPTGRINAGKYTYKVTFKGNYSGTVSKTMTIKPATVKASQVTLSKTAYVYDGNYKKPTVTVKDANGNKIASTNYTVTRSNNKLVGKATVKVVFKGNYTGTITKTFTINPKSVKLTTLNPISKGLSIKWSKQTAQATGYELQYATNSGFTQNAKTITISNTSTVSKKITGLKSGKKYFVRVRTYKTVNGTKYFSAWSNYDAVITK